MSITPKYYDTATLLGVMREQTPPSNYWLSLLFGRTVTFDDEYIDFERIPGNTRKLAPFVAPLAQGKPIYDLGSTVTRVRPSYVKAKDIVTPTRVMPRMPGELIAPTAMSPMARRDAIVADILRVHREAIERRWEWLAAKAAIDGAVTIIDDDMPKRVIDFQRSAEHTIVLSGGAEWDEEADILGDIQSWMDTMARSPFGGAADRLTVGPDAWAVMRKNRPVMKQMDTQVRGTEVSLKLGLTRSGEVRFVGTLGAGLDVYVYSDYYEAGGEMVPFMSPKDVVLTAPNVQGVRCYGAIQDVHAQYQALPVFPRNFVGDDPAVESVLSQSAPLMVPLNPNCTLKATVLPE